MAHARVEVTVAEPDPGDDVTFLLGANPGEAVLPLAKVASGGELARAMLALRLVLTDAPPTMVFDEVDAGVGGEAAQAVGQRVGRGRPSAIRSWSSRTWPRSPRAPTNSSGVRKVVDKGRTVAHAAVLEDDARVVELARMLSGQSRLRHGTTPRRRAPGSRDPIPRPGRPPGPAEQDRSRPRRSTGRLGPWSTVETMPGKLRA